MTLSHKLSNASASKHLAAHPPDPDPRLHQFADELPCLFRRMNQRLSFLLAWLAGGLLMASPTSRAATATGSRRTISLDGTWQLAEGTADQKPAQFERTVPMPGLVDQAVPAIDRRRFADRKAQPAPVSDAVWTNQAFWYRREFKLPGDVPAVANLLVRKAAYGSTVFVNGVKVGESEAAFTASRYDVRAALHGRGAANELVIRVGANRDSLPRTVPRGQDYEKVRYIPGLFDLSLIHI